MISESEKQEWSLKSSNNIYQISFNTWWDHITSCDLCEVCHWGNDEDTLEQCEEGKRLEQVMLKWLDKVKRGLVNVR